MAHQWLVVGGDPGSGRRPAFGVVRRVGQERIEHEVRIGAALCRTQALGSVQVGMAGGCREGGNRIRQWRKAQTFQQIPHLGIGDSRPS